MTIDAANNGGSGPPELRRAIKIVRLLIYCAAAAYACGPYERSQGEPTISRLATAYSIVHYGTFAIEDIPGGHPNRFGAQTIDKVRSGDRIISSKPPVMPLLMTAEYYLLHRLFGLHLDDERDTQIVVLIMTITLVGFAYLASLHFFERALGVMGLEPVARMALVAFLAFGSPFWSFSGMITNHVPAACMIIVTAYLAFGLFHGRLDPTPGRFFGFGLAAGLVATVDLPGFIWPCLFGLPLLVRFPKSALIWAGLGAAVPLGIHAGVMYAVTGSPMPVQMSEDMYLFQESYWRHPLGIDAYNEPKGTYLFHMTFGRKGIFLLYPVLLAGLAAAVRAVFKKGVPWRVDTLVGAAGCVILAAYYCLKTDNYGGATYGFRWFIAGVPILLLMGAPLYARARERWHWLLIGVLFGISFYSAWEGASPTAYAGDEWTWRLFSPDLIP